VVAALTATVAAGEAGAAAGVIRVPADAPTVQAAVNQATDGDVIRVAAGRFCGAAIDREVHLIGSPGTTIQGCAQPVQSGNLRAGFLLVDERASGTTIRGFRFDGVGVSNSNLLPLSFAVFGRDAHDVAVIGNRVDGTVQAITNTRGDHWFIAGNVIHDLTLFPCGGSGRCGGGDGIVVQQRDPAGDRAFGNLVLLNDITGATPDGQADFGMAGVFVLGQDHPLVALNRVAIPHNPTAPADAIGINVTDVCCGDPTSLLTTHHAIIIGNDGRATPVAVQIDPDASGGHGNSVGAIVQSNLGKVIIDGVVVQAAAPTTGAARAATATAAAARPQPLP
jgi:hypothetical protein